MFCMLHDIFETPFFLAAYNVLLFVILVIVLTLTFSILSDKIFRSKILHNIAGGNDKEDNVDYREDNIDYKKYVNVDEDIKDIKVGGKRNVKGGSIKYYYTIDKVETDINYEETKEELFIDYAERRRIERIVAHMSSAHFVGSIRTRILLYFLSFYWRKE